MLSGTEASDLPWNEEVAVHEPFVRAREETRSEAEKKKKENDVASAKKETAAAEVEPRARPLLQLEIAERAYARRQRSPRWRSTRMERAERAQRAADRCESVQIRVRGRLEGVIRRARVATALRRSSTPRASWTPRETTRTGLRKLRRQLMQWRRLRDDVVMEAELARERDRALRCESLRKR